MKEGADNIQTKIQAKAESVLKQGGDVSRGKCPYTYFSLLFWFRIFF